MQYDKQESVGEKESVDKKTDFKIKPKKSSLNFIFILIYILIMILPVFIIIVISDGGDLNKYTPKEVIKRDIVLAIGNGADLRSIKNIYENRPISFKSITDYFDQGSKKYYESKVSLSKILEDIRSNQFLGLTEKVDIEKLDLIIEEHNQINPFDSLEPSQKDSFENIRIKLDIKYKDIEIEIGKIVKELAEKNSLVNKYLAQSTFSYWVSIIALVLSLLIGIYQIFQSKVSSSKIINELGRKMEGNGKKRKNILS